ncbi:AAA family ATPase, partial [Bacillus paranthracis]|uniref:AAA family ATPase n=1 Tax=Bacillus paranthracis TaxID=2026186 RepID=UPI002E1E24B5|nr:AAA family ATPase [Bacillus paranthracis]
MKFYIKKLILWLRNGENREYDFLPNKVNVITGESGTGKSEILSIIDYCFFYSRADITEEKINENVNWYGIQFVINDKTYTIARGKIVKRKVSSEYYFSPQGDIPNIPKSNFGEKELKLIIEKEFGITERTVFPYGGKKISLGSKISFRYFFMFNTQSGDTIDHSEVFFDKQNNDKYREALERIFELGIGRETEENRIVKE